MNQIGISGRDLTQFDLGYVALVKADTEEMINNPRVNANLLYPPERLRASAQALNEIARYFQDLATRLES